MDKWETLWDVAEKARANAADYGTQAYWNGYIACLLDISQQPDDDELIRLWKAGELRVVDPEMPAEQFDALMRELNAEEEM